MPTLKTLSTAANPHPYTPAYSAADPLIRPMGLNGTVASHHYLASWAGLEILRQGGNAVDAAVAVSAALGVVEPAMNGPAGNGNMLIHRADDGRTYGLDFSGRVPSAAGQATSEDVYFGARAQLVPGNLGGWLAALERFGTMDRATVFAPAIRLAEDGQPVSPTLSYYMRRMMSQLQGGESGVASIFAPGGRPMAAGEILRQPDLANTYRAIVDGGADVFYRGEIAQQIARCVSARGGWLSADDLRGFAPDWEEPLAIEHAGWRVMTPPPPCSGVQILETLRLLEAFDVAQWDALSPEYLHLLVESIKLARYDRVFKGSSLHGADGARTFLSDEHIAALRASIDRTHAAESEGDWFVSPHTTHLSVADRAGNVVSSTQSLGAIFGSGVVVEGTGLILNGLLFLFELDPSAPNGIEPGKKMDDPMAPIIATHPDGRVLAVGSPGRAGDPPDQRADVQQRRALRNVAAGSRRVAAHHELGAARVHRQVRAPVRPAVAGDRGPAATVDPG